MKTFSIDGLSRQYQVKRLGVDDLDDLFELCSQNKTYYYYCPPMVTKESIQQDMVALPANKGMEDKAYVGFYQEGQLIAVMDLISGYPENKTLYIGFFMIQVSLHRQKVGSALFSEVVSFAQKRGYQSIQLGWMKENSQASGFWLANGFKPIGQKDRKGQLVIEARLKLRRLDDGNLCDGN